MRKTAKILLLTLGLLSGLAVNPAVAQPGPLTYLHHDAFGNPILATDAQGQVLWNERYWPFGAKRINPGGGPARIAFQGKEVDPETGLQYFGGRYYDPVVGRFTGMDPAGFREGDVHGFNRYAYGNNNPYRYVDPDGRDSVVANGRIYIFPVAPNVPKVNLPNNVGAIGISSSSRSFHKYIVNTSSGLTASEAGERIRSNPTPGNDSPASPMGTVNNAGPIEWVGAVNSVRSYSIPSPDSSRYTDISVNYTIAGEHGLNEGYVIRYGEIDKNGGITLRSYGEGNSILQAPALAWFWLPKVESTWQLNHEEINNWR